MTRRLDPDAIGDQLRAATDALLSDARTASIGLRLGDLRRSIAVALAGNEPVRIDPGRTERARRANLMSMGAGIAG